MSRAISQRLFARASADGPAARSDGEKEAGVHQGTHRHRGSLHRGYAACARGKFHVISSFSFFFSLSDFCSTKLVLAVAVVFQQTF